MTDIDLERLAVDREYWDSVAPEGSTEFGVDNRYFYMQADGVWLYAKANERDWCECSMRQPLSENRIPRPPKKAQEVEWDGESWPIPVGATVEVQVEPLTQFYVVEIIAHYDGSMVFIAGDDYPHGQYDGCSHPECFRPHKPVTKEQRLRDELGILIIKSDTGQGDVRPIVDAILARYNLEPKP